MRSWQHPFAVRVAGALLVRLVIEASGAKAGVAEPAVGMDDRADGDVGADKRCQRRGGSISEQLQPQPPGAVAANLDRDPDQRLAATLSAAPQVGVAVAEEALVDLDLACQWLALRRDHRTTQLVQDRPGCLVAGQTQLPAQLQRRDPRPVRADQIGGPEPHGQRQVKDPGKLGGSDARLRPGGRRCSCDVETEEVPR